MTPEQKQTILLFFVGVFVDIIAAPYCYAASEAAMAKEWSKAIVGYAIGIPLALTGLSTVAIALGVFPPSAVSSIALYVKPLATDPRWGLLVWFIVLVWLGGPRFVERMRAAWIAKPPQRKYDIRELAMPKKQMPPPSPEKVEAIRAMASALHGRPVGDTPTKLEPDKQISVNAQEKPKPRKALSAENERTLAMAGEIDRKSAEREAARRAFNAFSPTRPMTDLEEQEWLRLDVLFGVHVETVDSQERRYLTLKFLPDRTPQDAFSLLLILYGYRQIYGWQDVRASGLEECLYLSNVRKKLTTMDMILGKATLFDTTADRLNIDDVAKATALRNLVSERIRLAKGGFYELTDTGIKTAQDLFTDLVRRA